MRGCLFATFLAFLAISSASFAHSEQLRKSLELIRRLTVAGLGGPCPAAGLEWGLEPEGHGQDAQVRTNRPPWNEKAAAEVAKMFAEEKAGRPRPLFVNCLPEGMPSWMLITTTLWNSRSLRDA